MTSPSFVLQIGIFPMHIGLRNQKKKFLQKNSKDMGDPKDFMIILPISRRMRKKACSIFSSVLSLAVTTNFVTKNFYKSYFGYSILRNFPMNATR